MLLHSLSFGEGEGGRGRMLLSLPRHYERSEAIGCCYTPFPLEREKEGKAGCYYHSLVIASVAKQLDAATLPLLWRGRRRERPDVTITPSSLRAWRSNG